MATAKPRRGRKANTKNRGYFYRTGRGWYATEGRGKIPLTDERGQHLKDEHCGLALVKDAFSRYLQDRQKRSKQTGTRDDITIAEMAAIYLKHVEQDGSPATLELRGGILFDFCMGLPSSLWRPTLAGKVSKAEAAKRRIHPGYGSKLVRDLIPHDIREWIQAHPGWQRGRRTVENAVKRCINYGVEEGILSESPIRRYKRAKDNLRPTYITPEQEAALIASSTPAMAFALKVLIRTGARYGCEFCKVTAAHVSFTAQGMEWRFEPEQSKNKKLRIIRVKDAEIVEHVRELVALYPEGPLFRGHHKKPWTKDMMRQGFVRVLARARKKGARFDKGIRLYSCRHTFAKRTLQGYWTGTPTNIETLSILMGNSREECWKTYAQWCDTYTDPLWAAI